PVEGQCPPTAEIKSKGAQPCAPTEGFSVVPRREFISRVQRHPIPRSLFPKARGFHHKYGRAIFCCMVYYLLRLVRSRKILSL
ncbi:MAG: hypothetical protein M3O33_19710, partial [Cyanobacteriota bacterium]|nr:hypothetical protein [Cyanobacteriota bacterium]